MQCGDAQQLISAWIAVEIDDANLEKLSLHLSACQECRACTLSWQSTDRRLSRTLARQRQTADRVVARVVAALPDAGTGDMVPRSQPQRHTNRGLWRSIVIATAVGLLILALVFRFRNEPDSRIAVDTPQSPDGLEQRLNPSPMARLVAATGPVLVRAAASEPWQELTEASVFPCAPETEVATGPHSRCEIVTADGFTLRLNTDSRLIIDTDRRVRIRDGQIWCSATQTAGLELVADTTGTAFPRRDVVKCPPNSSFLAAIVDRELEVHAATGNLQLETAGGEQALRPGDRATIGSELAVEAEQAASALLAAGWMDSLLVRGTHHNPDLDLRVNALLAEIGRTKASLLYERELRGLGEHCVLPLTRFVMSDISLESPNRRLMSMRVIADASPTWNVENLILLLEDASPGIRVLAATALLRLTGESHGRSPAQWTAEVQPGDATLQRWKEWWTEKRELYPVPKSGIQRLSF